MSTDYRLVRTRSAIALPRSSSADSRPVTLITRTSSVPDLGAYFRYSDKYKPQWHTVSTTPWRWRRDYDLYDDYWYDRYYYFSPLYRTYNWPSRRYYYSDYLPNPYYWSNYTNYWTRYKGYWYDYAYSPYYYRSYWDPSYSSYLRSSYTPYRSYLLDSLSSSLQRGLYMYKDGLIPYSTLQQYWLTPSYWNQRFKDWRELYISDKSLYLPSYYSRRARQYFTRWS